MKPLHTTLAGNIADRVTGQRAGAQRAYWKRQLAGAPALLELPTDFARPAVPSGRGGMVDFVLPAALTQRLRYLAASTHATMFMVMVAAWQARCLPQVQQRPCPLWCALAQQVSSIVSSWLWQASLMPCASRRPQPAALMVTGHSALASFPRKLTKTPWAPVSGDREWGR